MILNIKTMSKIFETFGYHLDIMYQNKYYGSIKLEKPDREVMGYCGRQEMVLTEDWSYKNKKLKAGTKVITELFPLCGKMKGDIKKKLQVLQNSRIVYNS